MSPLGHISVDTNEGEKPLVFSVSQCKIHTQLEIGIKTIERKITLAPPLFHRIWWILIGVRALNEFLTFFCLGMYNLS